MTIRKSILQELNTYVPEKNRLDVIESRASHIIASAINLLDMIERTCSPEEAELMEKRFMSSIRGRDPSRFTRAVGRVKGDDDDEQTL